MRKFVPVVFDATHSVQLPSASAGDGDHPAASGGQPEFIPVLSRAAVAAGVDGVFMEVHDHPKEAKSDGANAFESSKLRGILKELLAIQQALTSAHAKP
jgi:2-dehydro-3-deoxyphosphooctonate aldolase (KDO 8-P synthase)